MNSSTYVVVTHNRKVKLSKRKRRPIIMNLTKRVADYRDDLVRLPIELEQLYYDIHNMRAENVLLVEDERELLNHLYREVTAFIEGKSNDQKKIV